MTDIWEILKKMDCEECAVHDDCDHDNLCAEWITLAKPELLENKEKAEKWDKLKPETKTILEISTEYSYDDIMAGRLSPDHIKDMLDKAYWEHGVQKGTWIIEFEKLKKKLEAIKTILLEAESDDPHVGEALILQKIADKLGVDKPFTVDRGKELDH